MAGEHHFSGKIMTASQHSGRERSEQLLQSLAVSTNRFLPGTGLSLQQNQQGQREEGMSRKKGKKKRRSWWVDHSFQRPPLSYWLFKEQFLTFFFSLMPLACAVILLMAPVWNNVGVKGTKLKDPLDSKSSKCSHKLFSSACKFMVSFPGHFYRCIGRLEV